MGEKSLQLAKAKVSEQRKLMNPLNHPKVWHVMKGMQALRLFME